MNKQLLTKLLWSFFLLIFFIQSINAQSIIESTVADYIQTYQERTDWEKLVSFYSDTLHFEDINLGLKMEGIEAFKKFYDWPNPDFQKLTPEQLIFKTEAILIQRNQAIIRGHFEPFIWKGERQEWAGDFVFWLYFNKAGKIVEQLDYVKYPSWIIKSTEKE